MKLSLQCLSYQMVSNFTQIVPGSPLVNFKIRLLLLSFPVHILMI